MKPRCGSVKNADKPAAAPGPDAIPATAACAWCGTALKDDEGFLLRVGARLCTSCAEKAGRIAASQKNNA